MKIKAKYLTDYDYNGVKMAQFVTEFSDVIRIKANYIGCELEKGAYYLVDITPMHYEKDGKKFDFFGFKVITRL